MLTTSHNRIGLIVTAVLLLAVAFGISFTSYHQANGQSSGIEDPVYKYATSSSVYVGTNIATVVAQASSGRTYLEISNISNATSTAATSIWCAVGVEPVMYTGIFINASSTRIWGRNDSVPVGRVKCLSAVASSTITVVEK